MTRFEELENKLSDICEEHFTDCTKCPAKDVCDEYTSFKLVNATTEEKVAVLEKMLNV